ncbi:DMT family transporter [Ottowia sp.]|uniref:DMT family transporter n=1 Tax=Ottowia sp. TaxID=1898956 RepID=UPI001DA37DF9|nr:DMT family transporter [Ottowia sp.]MCB2024082.1 DMT family transporter [Ottowia sp.]MCP5258664.1 DMT family transporter [Burkholderiaceae bacterium]HRW71485.1 DMT family transporter [Ottowia sp.]
MQAAWMIAAAFFFSSMAVAIKYASAQFSPLEIVFYRGIVGVCFMAFIARGRGVSLRTEVPMMHVWRNIVGVSALVAWFYAIAKLPLATAMTLNYMSGIWVATFLIAGTLALGKLSDVRRQGPLVLAVLCSFAGVVMLLRPTVEQNQVFGGLVGLLSGVLSGLAYMQVAALGRVGEPETRTVFYFSLGATLAGLVGMLATGVHAWTWPAAAWLLPLGVLAALGQLCMTRAYTHGATMVVANLQYSGIVFASLYGLLLFDAQIPLIGWAGMALIVVSGITATVLRARAMPNPPAEEL